MRISKLTVVSLSIFILIYIKISLLLFMNNVVDVVGHLRLVNGQSLIDHHVLDEAKMFSKRHILWRPVMKLYLWDQAAKDFTRNSDPMKSHPHRFFGHNCEPKNSSRLSSNLEIAKRVNTNEETMAIRQIFAYIKQEYAKIKKLLLTT